MRSPRPLTHELIQNVFLGFDLEVKHVIISHFGKHVLRYLILQQKCPTEARVAGEP